MRITRFSISTACKTAFNHIAKYALPQNLSVRERTDTIIAAAKGCAVFTPNHPPEWQDELILNTVELKSRLIFASNYMFNLKIIHV